MARPKKKVTVEDTTVEDTIEKMGGDEFVAKVASLKEDVEEVESPTIIETGNVNNGKKEYKNVITGLTYFED